MKRKVGSDKGRRGRFSFSSHICLEIEKNESVARLIGHKSNNKNILTNNLLKIISDYILLY